MREKQNFDDKKLLIRKKQQSKMDQQSEAMLVSGSPSDRSLMESSLSGGTQATRQYIIDNKLSQ